MKEEPTEKKVVVEYDGYPNQVALMCMERARSQIIEHYHDDGETPYVIREAYAKIVKDLDKVVARLIKVDTINMQRLTPCYTVENGKLVRTKLDVLIKLLQEQEGSIDF